MAHLGAYILVIVGGWAFVGASMAFMRWMVLACRPKSFRWLDFFVGGAERSVALTLYLCAPSYLAPFIGGWIALKFAAYWQAQPNSEEVPENRLLFLVGNVLSFGTAIAVGYVINPERAEFFAR